MNKFIKYAIVGAVGYQVGKLVVKYRLVKYVLDNKLKGEEVVQEKEDEAQ